MSNILADYKKTVIYKIQCKDENITDIYIGHTTSYYQRYRLHKSNCNNNESKSYNYKIYKIIRENGGWDNWEMSILENYPCNNINEAKERERYWIENQSATLNVSIPNRSKKEYEQIYRIVHKKELAEKAKEYRENNKDAIKAYLECNKEKISFQKQDWYEENKDEILEKAKQRYQENKDDKLEYQKKYAQEHKEEIAEKQKEYREKNKEKISEQKKEYREAHKEEAAKLNKEWREANKEKIKSQKCEVINCECGKQYTFGNKYRHLQSKIHIEYQNKLSGIVEQNVSDEDKKESLQEKQKEYREKNAEKIKELKKQYNEKNKDHIKEQTHAYYENHKEEIKSKVKQYVEENKDKVKEYKDNWYQKNKEKILEKQKQTFLCECGSEVRCAGKAEHLRSLKHKTYLDTCSATII